MSLFKNESEYQEFLRRKQAGRSRDVEKPSCSVGVEREIKDLHEPIMAYCNRQWPRIKYIRARSDMPSGITVGCHDFTLFLPGNRTLCIECKKKDGKVSVEQAGWIKEMAMLEHIVHIVRSMEEFYALVEKQGTPDIHKVEPGHQ